MRVSSLPSLTSAERLGWRIVGWLLNGVYAALLLGVLPVLMSRALRLGKYRSGWSQKLWGSVPYRTGTSARDSADHACYWFHAVSVGEVLLLQTVIAELRRREPAAEIVISTTTATGQKVATEKFPDCEHCYFPLDFTWAVNRAIQRIKPTQIVLVELELWPNFISAVRRIGVPLTLINGRLSERSFRGYGRLPRALTRRVLRCFEHIAAQTPTYAQRFLVLGADPERVSVTGSVKYDRVETNRSNPRTLALRAALGVRADELVLVAGSTQAPEEQIALNVWRTLKDEFSQLRLILVPRHQERFEEVARLVTASGCSLVRRSQVMSATNADRRAVFLLDTLGELSDCWGLADFAFVGGSLTPRGGQNMIEPAGYGAAVCFGPNTRNFRDVVENLVERQAAVVVANEVEFAATILHWLKEPGVAWKFGQRAQEFVATQRGASSRTVDLLCEPTNAAVRHAA